VTLRAWTASVAGSRGEHLVTDVSLDVRPGELLGLIGPNGAGKSTFLKTLVGFKPLVGGAVTLDERPLASVPLGERARRIAYLEQEGRIEWRLSVRDVVALGRRPHRAGFGFSSALDAAAVARALAAVEMTGFADAPATELSAGERARVLLARALAVEAPILLADEPTASLDPYHQLLVMETLKAKADAGGAVLVVLHDLALAARFLDRVVLMSEGAILDEGPPWKVLTDDNLAAVYRIAAVRGREGSASWVLPWERR
jgi:iron complex transport system ATP-binding protein